MMSIHLPIGLSVMVFVHGLVVPVLAQSGPFDGRQFKGRIAFSSDGNFNDEDDWGAFPIAAAMLEAFGVTDKLVHVDYNNILTGNDPRFYREMTESVLGAVERYKLDRSALFDCQKDLEGAIENIRKAIDASSADDPLYYVLAGPMEVPFRGIQRSDPAKREFVYCISHSGWNDGYSREDDALFRHNKRDVIPSGIQWIQCRDGNRFLAHPGSVGAKGTPDQWRLYQWLRDSSDPRLNWIFTRLQAEGRPDISDSTMTYFLLTGDEDATLPKVRSLIDRGQAPVINPFRRSIRIEAENFRHLGGYDVEFGDRAASKRLCVKLQAATGHIRTAFNDIYAADGRYDVDVRTLDGRGSRSHVRLSVNDVVQGVTWTTSGKDPSWTAHTLTDVQIRRGDEIRIDVRAEGGDAGRLDYVQLNYRSEASASKTLDDPKALPGQVIVAGERPGYLKYNGGGPIFLVGPDNPEDFLFRGRLRADGTRSGGGQAGMIRRMGRAGLNAFHCQMFRMRVCNIKNEGDDTHGPFVDHDPSKPLDEDVLDQWEGWLDQFEENGIVVHLEFYNDATDVERMGWTLDPQGNLHPHEQRWIEGIVHRFKHHKNILWGIEESCNKLPAGRTRHFKKIAEVIARADNHHHPIVQSFVVPDDPEGDFPPGGMTPDAYVGDPHINVVTWLHVAPHGDDYEAQHRAYLHYRQRDAKHFVALKNETYHHPRRGAPSRRYMWSCAMTGMHCLEAYHHADDGADGTLWDDARIRTFMEQTDFHTMRSRDDLAAGATRWVLADPGRAYIAYTYAYEEAMGVKDLSAGRYDLTWFDPIDGDTFTQTGVWVDGGEATWSKPEFIGEEVALYVRRSAREASR